LRAQLDETHRRTSKALSRTLFATATSAAGRATSRRVGNLAKAIVERSDRHVQAAIALVFARFAELRTVRQVHLWMRQERLPLPSVGYGPQGRCVTWKLPVYNTLHHMLTNPIYAGDYAFGVSVAATTSGG